MRFAPDFFLTYTYRDGELLGVRADVGSETLRKKLLEEILMLKSRAANACSRLSPVDVSVLI